MGSDMRVTTVRTGTHNGRRVLILKDSFGNALPGYLFFSFEEVHVVDSRYFLKNMQDYVRDNHITDILFANNIFKAYSSHTYGSYLRFLNQKWQRPQPLRTDSVRVRRDSTVTPAATPVVTPATNASPGDSASVINN